MLSENSSLEELSGFIYKALSKAHEQVKTLGTKTFFTFKDAVLIFNANRFLQNQNEKVMEECNTVEKCVSILEQALNVAHSRGSYTLEDCVVLNGMLSLLKQKSVSKVQQQENVKETEKEVEQQEKVKDSEKEVEQQENSDSESENESFDIQY